MSAVPDNDVGDGWLERHLPVIQLGIAFFGSLVVLSYPLGFLILVLQLITEYGYAWIVASHAVSLLPASVVIAASIYSLYFAAPATLVLIVLLGRLTDYLSLRLVRRWGIPYQRPLPQQRPPDHGRRNRMLGLLPIVLLETVAYTAILVGVFFGLNPFRALLLFFSFFIGTVSGWFGASRLRLGHARFRTGRPYGRFYRVLVLGTVAIAAVLAAVIGAAAAFSPHLPLIELNLAEGTSQEGELLVHSDGVWHIIDSSDANSPIIMINHDEVTDATKRGPGYAGPGPSLTTEVGSSIGALLPLQLPLGLI